MADLINKCPYCDRPFWYDHDIGCPYPDEQVAEDSRHLTRNELIQILERKVERVEL